MQTEPVQIPIEVLDQATGKLNAVGKELQKLVISEKAQQSFRGLSAAQKDLIGSMTSATSAAKKQGLQFTELRSALQLAGQGLRYLKQGYDFAKEGAQLDMTVTRFDRLAGTIDTTAKALTGDLRTATRGTMSDMELMASATDFMALGLAKSHEEAVRLAAVAGGLGMNMNQLVLTLTNQTTMRFDALGVSVDGFKEKVKELEKGGMDANAAFKEAFLTQAEDQLTKVGHAADTTAGTFMRLEAHFKNLGDEAKRSVAGAIAPSIAVWMDSVDAFKEQTAVLDAVALKYGMTRDQLTRAMAASKEFAATVYDEGIAFMGVIDAAEQADRALLNHKNVISAVRTEAADFKAGLSDLNFVIRDGLSAAQDEYNEKIAAYTVELSKARKEEDRAGILEKIQAETDAYYEKARAISFSIAQQQVEAVIAADPSQAAAALGFLNDLALSYGMVDEKSKKALDSQTRLIDMAAEGEITWAGAARVIETNTNLLAGIPLSAEPATTAIGGASEAMKELKDQAHNAAMMTGRARDQLEQLDGMVATATVNINVNGRIPSLGPWQTSGTGQHIAGSGGSLSGFAAGGVIGKGSNKMFTVGEQGWEAGVVNPDGSVTIIPHGVSKKLAELGLIGDVPGFAFAGHAGGGGGGTPTTTVKPPSAASGIAAGGNIVRDDSMGGIVGVSSATNNTEPSVPVATLTNVVTQEVTRMGSAMTQATVANVSATDRQTEMQERGNDNIVAKLDTLNKNIMVLADTIVDRIGAAEQKRI